MKKLLALSASAALGLAPAIGVACEYSDAAQSASVAPPAVASTAPATEATKISAPVAKSQKATKTAPDKAKAAQPDQKVAALTRS